MARATTKTTTADDAGLTLGYVFTGGSSSEPQSVPGVPGLWISGVARDPRELGFDAIEFGELIAAAGVEDVFAAAEVEPWVYNETLEDAIINLETDLANEAAIGFAEGANAEYITLSTQFVIENVSEDTQRNVAAFLSGNAVSAVSAVKAWRRLVILLSSACTARRWCCRCRRPLRSRRGRSPRSA